MAVFSGYKNEEQALAGAKDLYSKGWTNVQLVERNGKLELHADAGAGIKPPEKVTVYRGGGTGQATQETRHMTPEEQAEYIRKQAKKKAETLVIEKREPQIQGLPEQQELAGIRRETTGGVHSFIMVPRKEPMQIEFEKSDRVVDTRDIKDIPIPEYSDMGKRTITYEEMQEIERRRQQQYELQQAWERAGTKIEIAKERGTPVETFLLSVGEQFGFPQAKLLGIDKELREKTIKFILEQPETVIRTGVAGAVAYPKNVFDQIVGELERGQPIRAVGTAVGVVGVMIAGEKITRGIGRTAKTVKTKIVSVLEKPVTKSVNVDLSYTRGASITTGKDVKVTYGTFETAVKKGTVKGKVASVSTGLPTKKSTISKTIVDIPEQRIGRVKVSASRDLTFAETKISVVNPEYAGTVYSRSMKVDVATTNMRSSTVNIFDPATQKLYRVSGKMVVPVDTVKSVPEIDIKFGSQGKGGIVTKKTYSKTIDITTGKVDVKGYRSVSAETGRVGFGEWFDISFKPADKVVVKIKPTGTPVKSGGSAGAKTVTTIKAPETKPTLPKNIEIKVTGKPTDIKATFGKPTAVSPTMGISLPVGVVRGVPQTTKTARKSTLITGIPSLEKVSQALKIDTALKRIMAFDMDTAQMRSTDQLTKITPLEIEIEKEKTTTKTKLAVIPMETAVTNVPPPPVDVKPPTPILLPPLIGGGGIMGSRRRKRGYGVGIGINPVATKLDVKTPDVKVKI